jgi:hypothetical protein
MAMANAGFDGTVTEADYAYMWAVGGQDGVESAAAWKVTQGTGRQISCAAQSGRAFAKGVVSKDTAANLVSLSTPTNGGWYLICRHIDWTANTVTVIALTGPTTTTTLPTVPPVDYSSVTGMASSPGATYDHPLAWAWVRSSDTTMVIFDLRRVPGSASDLTELATLGGSEGDTKIVREGGATFIRSSGVWVQRTIATFATTTDRDTAYAKASAAYRAQNAQARDLSTMSVSTYFALYNASSNPGGAKAAGWYPTSLGPSGRMARSTTAAPLATNGWAVLAASAFSDTVAGADKAVGMPTPFATNGGWTAPVDGVYGVDASAYVSGTGTGSIIFAIKKNDATATNAGIVISTTSGSAGTDAAAAVSGQIALAAGDILRIGIFSGGTAGTISTSNPAALSFGIQYLRPIRG